MQWVGLYMQPVAWLRTPGQGLRIFYSKRNSTHVLMLVVLGVGLCASTRHHMQLLLKPYRNSNALCARTSQCVDPHKLNACPLPDSDCVWFAQDTQYRPACRGRCETHPAPGGRPPLHPEQIFLPHGEALLQIRSVFLGQSGKGYICDPSFLILNIISDA